jgi:peptidoglycan-N-acetylglucosamine deacetylase
MAKRKALIAAASTLAFLGALAALRAVANARTFQLFGRLVAHVSVPDRRVALTFDDGPVTAQLDTILRLLESRGTHATFFVTGEEVSSSPDAARRLVTAGHELGNHSFSHRRMILLSPDAVRREIERTDSAIRAVGYQHEIYFRPPYGYKLIALPWYLARHTRTTIMWDIEPDSFREVAATSQGIISHVLARVTPGAIILLHPWYKSRATSLGAIGPLIDSLHQRGFRVVPVRDLVK